MDTEAKMMILDMNSSGGDAIRFVVTYTLTGAGQPDFFRRLEVFLRTSQPLVKVVDYNAVFEPRLDCMRLSE